MKHIVSLSGGKDSTAMLLMMLERNMPIDHVLFFDTGWEFPQMYEHIAKVEDYTGIEVTRLHDEIGLTERMLHNHRTRGKRVNACAGFGWPTPLARWCTTYKVKAMYFDDDYNPHWTDETTFTAVTDATPDGFCAWGERK